MIQTVRVSWKTACIDVKKIHHEQEIVCLQNASELNFNFWTQDKQEELLFKCVIF